MGIFKKLSAAKTAVSAPQTYKNNPFSLLDSYTPLSTVQNSLYRELREAIPIIDAAIYKIIRLTGGFHIDCENKRCERELRRFLSEVKVGSGQQGIDFFMSVYFEQLLTISAPSTTPISAILSLSAVTTAFQRLSV